MRDALDWLLQHYRCVKLWMGLESEDGAELFLTAAPSRKAEIVDRLQVYQDQMDIFEMSERPAAVGE
jgi:hypothetical protein